MPFSGNEYREAVADYRASWCVIDEVLYDLCRRYPDHTDARGVNAKLWIIGRTYATGIERKIATSGSQGSSMTRLSGYLRDHAQELDLLLEQLRQVAEPLTQERLQVIVDCHGQFLKLLKGVTRSGQTARSFASKYLHFHCPAVPIIDSYAAGMLRTLVRWREDLEVFAIPQHADRIYAWYVMRFWCLYQTASDALRRQDADAGEATVSVKYLDYYLMWLAGMPS